MAREFQRGRRAAGPRCRVGAAIVALGMGLAGVAGCARPPAHGAVAGSATATSSSAHAAPTRLRCPAATGTPSASATPGGPITVGSMRVAAWTGSADGYRQRPSVVYDAGHGRYRTLDDEMAVPDPEGRRVAVVDNANGQPGILDLATGDTVRLDLGGRRLGMPEWAPDGSRLLWTVGNKSTGDFGFTMVDPGGQHRHTVWIPHGKYDMNRPRFSWYPDGRHVVASIARRTDAGEAAPDLADHVQLFDLTGKASSTVPVAGYLAGASAWSPDRRHVVVYQGVHGGGLNYRVVDTSDGRVAAETHLDYRAVAAPVAWWADDDHLLLRTEQHDGTVTVCDTTLSGHVSNTWRLPVPPDLGVATLLLRSSAHRTRDHSRARPASPTSGPRPIRS